MLTLRKSVKVYSKENLISLVLSKSETANVNFLFIKKLNSAPAIDPHTLERFIGIKDSSKI